MASVTEFWQDLNRQAKIGIGTGAVLIVALTIGIAVWAWRADYQPLFVDLTPADASAMAAELDRQKIPYQLTDGGNTILVPKELVYKTRLKVMGKDLPLHGAVGFEVFNNADFGMTEFVQKVNYQRAIQGELTRTILSVEDIQSARVHLAIPEQGLFKKATAKPKASVTLVMKPGRVLAQEQVAGIQRLIAASVPDIVAADVTILDQHGVALTRTAGTEPGLESAAQLDAKRAAEDYLTRKVSKILDSTFGVGETIATVDVLLNLDQVRITTEEVLPAKTVGADGVATGVVVRERQTSRDNTGAASVGTRDSAPVGTSTSESDYQVGKRVEQVVTAPGATRRMTVAVVVKNAMSEAQLDKLKEVVSLAVGLNAQRGDAVVIYAMDRLADPARINVTAPVDSVDAVTISRSNQQPKLSVTRETSLQGTWVGAILGLLALAIICVALWWRQRAQLRVTRPLTSVERDKLLRQIRHWIDDAPQPIAGRAP